MSDDYTIKITRRRALGGLATVGAASTALGAGTMAYFSDEAESQNNTITSGNIDLTTNNNENPTTTVDVSDVAPGDSGSQAISLENTGSIGGFLSLEFGTPNVRNDLAEVLKVTVVVAGNQIRRGTFDTVFDGEGEWSNADIPLGANSSKTLRFDWEVPTGAGNDIQDQSAVGDITIRLSQQEEAFADLVVDPASGQGNVSTIQEGVNDIPSGGVLLVRDGTYNEAVTVNKADLTIASKNGPGATELVPDPDTDGNKALLVDGVDDVTVDGLRVSLGADQPDNSEKYAIRGRPDGSGGGPDGLTVRNCLIEDITAEDVSSNSGAVRATGIVVDLEPTGGLGPATMSNFVVENNSIRNIQCVGDIDQNDSRAKGISTNGDVDGASIVRNSIENIGTTTNDDPNVAEEITDSSNSAEGTEKPRGITFTEDSNGDGTTNFTILDTLIQGVEGTYGQPAIFIGGTNSLGSDHEVYNNEFHHPVDNLTNGGALRLRENTWVNDADDDGVPELVSADQDEDGGNLIDRGASAYDTTYAI